MDSDRQATSQRLLESVSTQKVGQMNNSLKNAKCGPCRANVVLTSLLRTGSGWVHSNPRDPFWILNFRNGVWTYCWSSWHPWCSLRSTLPPYSQSPSALKNNFPEFVYSLLSPDLETLPHTCPILKIGSHYFWNWAKNGVFFVAYMVNHFVSVSKKQIRFVHSIMNMAQEHGCFTFLLMSESVVVLTCMLGHPMWGRARGKAWTFLMYAPIAIHREKPKPSTTPINAPWVEKYQQEHELKLFQRFRLRAHPNLKFFCTFIAYFGKKSGCSFGIEFHGWLSASQDLLTEILMYISTCMRRLRPLV